MKRTHDEQLQFENRNLCNDILERNYYSQFRKGRSVLEIFLTGRCRQKCEYCYIHQHGNELYPSECCDTKTILRNLEKTLEWYKQNKFKCNIDIFSAEWVPTSIGPKVMDIFYNAFKDAEYKPKAICVPDNMSWITNDEITARAQAWIDKMKTIGIIAYFSASVDGKYCDDSREAHVDEYYQKLFDFLDKNQFGVHPMIASQQIENWIDNINWWYHNAPLEVKRYLYLLEVRDDSWTEDKILSYLKFLDYYTDRMVTDNLDGSKESKILQLQRVLDLIPEKDENSIYGANPVKLLPQRVTTGYDVLGCSLFSALIIRMGDMAVPLCHRLSYKELLIGKFNQDEEGNILDFEPSTGELLIFKTRFKPSCTAQCEACPYVGVCGQYCVGAAYEVYNDLFVPPYRSCMLQQSKFRFLINKYYSLGLFDYLDEIPMIDSERDYLKSLVQFVIHSNVQEGEN